MTTRPIHGGRIALVLALSLVAGRAASFGQEASSPRTNEAPALTLGSTCGPSITVGESCAIIVAARDRDHNLDRVELNWNDGTPMERRAVTGGGANVTFSRLFDVPRTVTWSATAYDMTGLASEPLGGTLTVTAAPPPATAPSARPPGNGASAASEQEIAPLVVMIRGKFPDKATVGAGIILGVASDRLYVATANHVVRGERALGGTSPVAEDLQVQLRWLRGEWQPARVLEESYDEEMDLAVITVPGANQLAVPQLPWASLVQPDTLTSGERVSPIGYPGGMPWFLPHQPHVVSSLGSRVIRTEGDLAPGYSGGALVTGDWGIAGIVLNMGSVLNDVLRIDVAVQQLRNWGHEVDATFKERPRASDTETDPAASLARDRLDAEGCVSRWMAAMLSNDVKTLLSMAEMPFYFDQEILVRREDLQARLQMTEPRAADNTRGWKIQSIRAMTVGELRAKGEEANRDRVLRNLSMSDSDWQVVVLMAMAPTSRTEGVAFFVRKVGGVMKMVGLWD